MHAPLTDFHVFALALDAERQRLSSRIDALVELGGASRERSLLEQQRREIGEELEALRGAIAKLRAEADPGGSRL